VTEFYAKQIELARRLVAADDARKAAFARGETPSDAVFEEWKEARWALWGLHQQGAK
jgi:hypothetical protein